MPVKMGKVEAQTIAIHKRACLLDVRAQYFAQGCMQEVRPGVVAHGGVARVAVHHGVNHITHGYAFACHDAMRKHALHRLGRAFYLGHNRLVIACKQHAYVAYLPAGVGIEAGRVEHGFAFRTGCKLVDAEPTLHQREHPCAFDP